MGWIGLDWARYPCNGWACLCVYVRAVFDFECIYSVQIELIISLMFTSV